MLRPRGNLSFTRKPSIAPTIGNELSKLAQAIANITYGDVFPGRGATFGDMHFYTGENTTSYKKNNWYVRTIDPDAVWQGSGTTSVPAENIQAGTIGTGVKVTDYLALIGGTMGGPIQFHPSQTIDPSFIGAGTLPYNVTVAGYLPLSGGILVGNTDISDKNISSIGKLYGYSNLIYVDMSVDGHLSLAADAHMTLTAPAIDLVGAVNVTGSLAVGGAPVLTAETDPVFLDRAARTAHYTGWPNRTETSLAWSNASATLTIGLTGAYYNFFIEGVQYNNTIPRTLALSVAQEAVSGLYWFWIELVTGVATLKCQIGAPGFDKCLVATVYWNTTTNKGILSDERHWMGRDKWWHEYTHETIGARYAAGLTGSFTDTTFSITAGEFYDEDIEHPLSSDVPMAYPGTALTVCKVLYHDGTSEWQWSDNSTTLYYAIAGVPQINSGATLTPVTNNKYFNCWVFATGSTINPIHSVVGTAEYNTLALARAASVPSFGTLESAELKLIYRVTFQRSGASSVYQEAADYRTTSVLPSTPFVASDHSVLSKLDYASSGHTGFQPAGAYLTAETDPIFIAWLQKTNECEEAVLAGQILYMQNNSKVKLAKADSSAHSNVCGLAIASALINSSCTYIQDGKLTLADWTDATGSATLTVGSTYYLDPANYGMITTVAPTTDGQYVVSVGLAVASDTLELDIEQGILL